MPTMIDLSNSYVLLEEAESYFSGRLYATAWNNATESDKEKALLTSVSLLDNAVLWAGEKRYERQDLEFPRKNIRGLPEDLIPKNIKTAQLELALLLLQTDLTAPQTSPEISSIQVESIKLQYNRAERSKIIPDSILALVSVYTSQNNVYNYFDLTR